MVQGSQWPSFIIQGILLGTNIYLIAPGNVSNQWIFISILIILMLFCLQVTSARFIYLFPVIRGTNIPTTHVDTHIIRIGILLSSFFLYLGLYRHYPILGKWWFLALGLVVLVIFPIIFNFCINEKIEKKISEKHNQVTVVGINDKGKFHISSVGIVWQPKEKQYKICWDELQKIIERK